MVNNNDNTNRPDVEKKKLNLFKKSYLFSSKLPAVLALMIIPAICVNVQLKKHLQNDMNDTSISDTGNPDRRSDAPELDENAGEYVDENDSKVSGGVSIPGWSTIKIPADSEEISVDFFNPEENSDLYYLTFELRLPDDSEQGYEVLYTSGLVKPGLHIQKINLSRTFKKGTYDAVIHVQPYRMDENKTATNNADLKTELVVM